MRKDEFSFHSRDPVSLEGQDDEDDKLGLLPVGRVCLPRGSQVQDQKTATTATAATEIDVQEILADHPSNLDGEHDVHQREFPAEESAP